MPTEESNDPSEVHEPDPSSEGLFLRVIAATLLSALGLAGILWSVVMLVREVSDPAIPFTRMPIGYQLWKFEYWMFPILADSAIVFAAIQIYRGKTRAGALITVVAFGLLLVHPFVQPILRSVTIGDRFIIPP